MIQLKTRTEIEYIRKSNRIIAEIHEKLLSIIKPGVTTRQIDSFAEEYILSKGARPAFKGYTPGRPYPPFPSATCTSVNEEVIHGIPGDRALAEGDIISVDIGTELSGYYGDASYTYLVGKVSPQAARLSEDTRTALDKAIEICRSGTYLNEIGRVISFYLQPRGYGIVRDYCGHGVGKAIHEEPPVVNYYDPRRKGPRLKPGMVLAIEPMITLGTHEVDLKEDHWTVVTRDGSLAVHWEHSIAITDGEPIVLSRL